MEPTGPRRIAFQAIRKLGEYDLSEKYDASYLEEVIHHGMRRHFKNPDEPVRVWFEIDPSGNYADVHIEIVSSTHDVLQPWVLSLCREPVLDWDAFQRPCITFEDAEVPFLLDGDFHWPGEIMDTEHVLRGLLAWSEFFWPDWKPTFVEQRVPRLSFLDEFEGAFQHLYLITPNHAITEEVHEYLIEEGFAVVMQNEEGIVLSTAPARLSDLKSKFPDLISEEFLPLE